MKSLTESSFSKLSNVYQLSIDDEVENATVKSQLNPIVSYSNNNSQNSSLSDIKAHFLDKLNFQDSVCVESNQKITKLDSSL